MFSGLKISFPGIVIGVICLGIGYFFLVASWGAYLQYQRLADYDGRAIGRVTQKYSKTSADSGGNYYLDYWFMTSAGGKISASAIISKQQWDMLRIDDILEIRFNLSNPHQNTPMHGGNASLAYAFFMLFLGAVFIIFGLSRLLNSFNKKSQLGKQN